MEELENSYTHFQQFVPGTNIEKIVDGSTQVYDDNVAASTGLVLEYFDASGNATNIISDIQKISVTLNMIDPDNERAFIQFKTDVSLRNIST